eukprot:TRINITY_DN1977_c3_g3_i1.p1 TRINITY_DN1977_c3_g3~~TRINITY_DN1977_c3_g3_i1.p1  ORF type:complete len:588 (+),score=82.30 TRINITY_DN1977_c3_g3_i1:53-1765(+)
MSVKKKLIMAVGLVFIAETSWKIVTHTSLQDVVMGDRKTVAEQGEETGGTRQVQIMEDGSAAVAENSAVEVNMTKEETEEPDVPTIKPTEAPLTPLPQAVLGGSTRLGDLDPNVQHWYLGVCASTAQSSEWLREWIELQLISGVGHIWVINDNPPGQDEDTATILQEYEDMGYVTVLNGMPKYHPGCGTVPNCISPKVCYEIAHQFVDWLIFADTDEFIYPTMNCDVSSHVLNYCDHDEAYHLIRWERFGTSGHYDHPVGLMTENFLASGGDCTAHYATGRHCFVHVFDYCLECRHSKVLYNTAKCIGVEHAGHPHNPTNTTHFKKHPEFFPGGIVQEGSKSIWRDPSCTETEWEDNRLLCMMWLEHGGGSKFPPEPSKDCCTAGIGYNHYGTKSMSRWNKKMNSAIKRGFRPADFSIVEQNSTIASNVLRFVRALRERFLRQGIPVASNVDFEDVTEGACFVERGWEYVAIPDRGTVPRRSPANTTSACCSDCWNLQLPNGHCGGWTFNPSTSNCTLIFSPFNSWRLGMDLGFLRWPHTSFTADRVMNDKYISGIPLHEGECPLPEHLK